MRTATRGAPWRAIFLVAVLVTGGTVFAPWGAAKAQTSGVSIQNVAYNPTTVRVDVGETVRWINDDPAPHTVTSEAAGLFSSGVIEPGGSYSRTFDTAGDYQYFCTVHPRLMRGVVLVGDAQGAPSAPPDAVTPGQVNLQLSGANEVPPVATVAQGSYSHKLDPAVSKRLDFDLQAFGVGFTMAHIHVGAPGTNGPVVAFLFGPVTAGVNTIDVTGTVRPENLVGPLAGNWDGFLAAVMAGNTYVNAHTTAHPGGEIRAQIPASGTAPRPPATGSGNATTTVDFASWPALVALLAAAAYVALTVGAAEVRRRRTR